MYCPNCGTLIDDHSLYCRHCDIELSNDVSENKKLKRDVSVLLCYIGWIVLNYVLIVLVNKFLLSRMMRDNASPTGVGSFFTAYSFIVTGIDVLLLITAFLLLKNRTAKTCILIFGVLKAGLFVFQRI